MLDETTNSREELIRNIREASRDNRNRINSRTSTVHQDNNNTYGEEELGSNSSFLKIRCFLAASLFIGFLVLQSTNSSILKYDATKILDKISTDITVQNVMNQVKQFVSSSLNNTDLSTDILEPSTEKELP